MNPVRAISREVAGACRSLRYDLRRKRSGGAPAPAAGDHLAEPPMAQLGRARQRLVLAAAGLVLVALAGGGIFGPSAVSTPTPDPTPQNGTNPGTTP